MQFVLSSPPPTQILTKINEPKDFLHLPEGTVVHAEAEPEGHLSPLTSLRPQRPDTDPGWLHHGRHGGVLRAAHRRGQGSIPGADEPEQCGASLQRHHAGLQTHLQERGFPGTLERCRSRAPLTWALAHRKRPPRHGCLVVSPGTLPNITRNALVNCTELVTYDMIKEAILRHKLMSGVTHKHILTFLSLWGLLWT